MKLDNFLYTKAHYRGSISPNNLVFNANLQEFAQRISYIANLETAGKISSQEAYQQISELWHCLDTSYYHLMNQSKS